MNANAAATKQNISNYISNRTRFLDLMRNMIIIDIISLLSLSVMITLAGPPIMTCGDDRLGVVISDVKNSCPSTNLSGASATLMHCLRMLESSVKVAGLGGKKSVPIEVNAGITRLQ